MLNRQSAIFEDRKLYIVGASNEKGDLNCIFNYGGIDIIAPGESIRTVAARGKMEEANGTSLAALLVVGVKAPLVSNFGMILR